MPFVHDLIRAGGVTTWASWKRAATDQHLVGLTVLRFRVASLRHELQSLTMMPAKIWNYDGLKLQHLWSNFNPKILQSNLRSTVDLAGYRYWWIWSFSFLMPLLESQFRHSRSTAYLRSGSLGLGKYLKGSNTNKRILLCALACLYYPTTACFTAPRLPATCWGTTTSLQHPNVQWQSSTPGRPDTAAEEWPNWVQLKTWLTGPRQVVLTQLARFNATKSRPAEYPLPWWEKGLSNESTMCCHVPWRAWALESLDPLDLFPLPFADSNFESRSGTCRPHDATWYLFQGRLLTAP